MRFWTIVAMKPTLFKSRPIVKKRLLPTRLSLAQKGWLEQEQNKLTKNSKSKIIKWMGELLYFGRLSENLYKIQGEIEKTRKEKTQ